jgi:hypothetical protein
MAHVHVMRYCGGFSLIQVVYGRLDQHITFGVYLTVPGLILLRKARTKA